MTMPDTKETIMRVARAMVQARGYNALSFRDLAKEVGIKSASIHYHFPTKGDLGAALARRYTEDAIAYFDGMLAETQDLTTCLKTYTDVFRSALENDNRMCLCGIMSAEFDDLPADVRSEVDRFTDANVQWLIKLLSSKKSPSTTDSISPQALQQRAMAIFAAIEGAQLVARGRGDITIFDQTIDAYRATGLLP